MSTYLERIPPRIQEHLKQIATSSGLGDTRESVERVARAWIEKNEIFEQKIADFAMKPADSLSVDEKRGALVLTYSGSLVLIGPVSGDGEAQDVRLAAYSSIGLRRDVPASATSESARLKEPITPDEPVVFEQGPVQRTSSVYRIAVSAELLTAPDERQKLLEATAVLAEDFAEINRTIVQG
ncbi:MAG: hypothetical protein ACLFM0_10460 [Spirochaetales bacterium]